jgi:hypothetical protein
MIKVHHPEFDQEELLKSVGNVVSLIESQAHVKEASSSVVSQKLIEDHKPDKDHFMVHLIAMGDGENFGQNKNGDYWPKKANSTYHNTFVTNGHFFREHNNRSKDVSIGLVKASAHNDPMGRIELIIHGDKKKAEEEYELIKAGKALAFSMSARVPSDRCNICNNEATKSAEYCDHLKKSMNQYLPEFQKFAYAINDKPTFFDISRVKNPADRIAYYLDYDFDENELKKSASGSKPIIFSDELARAEGVVIPDLSPASPEIVSILNKLASAEEYIEAYLNGEDIAQDEKYEYVKHALTNTISNEDSSPEEINALRSIQPSTLFNEFVKKGTIMPLDLFMAYVNDQSLGQVRESNFYKQACGCMGNMFRSMGSGGGLEDIIKMFAPSSNFITTQGGARTDDVQKLMDSVADRHSHMQKPNLTKIIRITIRPAEPKMRIIKIASETSEADNLKAEKLVKAYGAYKLATVKALKNLHGDSYFDESKALALVYHNNV